MARSKRVPPLHTWLRSLPSFLLAPSLSPLLWWSILCSLRGCVSPIFSEWRTPSTECLLAYPCLALRERVFPSHWSLPRRALATGYEALLGLLLPEHSSRSRTGTWAKCRFRRHPSPPRRRLAAVGRDLSCGGRSECCSRGSPSLSQEWAQEGALAVASEWASRIPSLSPQQESAQLSMPQCAWSLFCEAREWGSLGLSRHRSRWPAPPRESGGSHKQGLCSLQRRS